MESNYNVSMIDGSPNYLIHYGVKGMKWGVRNDYVPTGEYRHINRNQGDVGSGRGTSSSGHGGSSGYSTPSSKKSRGQSIVNKWGPGKTTTKNNFINKHRKAIRNTLLATAALSAAAVVGINVYKRGLMKSDRILKAGTLVQNIAPPGRDFNTTFYGVNEVADMKYYAKNFTTKDTAKEAGRNIATLLTNKNDVQIAGKDAMDRAFRKAYGNNILKREIFYRRLGALKPAQKQKFFDELQKAGYGGHKDINDMQFLFGGNTPTVFFGKNSGFTPAGSYKVNVNRAKKMRVLTGVGKRTIAETSAGAVSVSSIIGAKKLDNQNRRKS